MVQNDSMVRGDLACMSAAAKSAPMARILLKSQAFANTRQGEFIIMATTTNTLNAKALKDLPVKKEVKGGMISDPVPIIEYSRI